MNLALIALLLQLISVSTSRWSVRSQEAGPNGVSLDIYMGLWKICTDAGDDRVDMIGCKYLPPDDPMFPTKSLHTVRTLVLVGILLTLCGLVAKKRICLIAGGICSLLACVVWYNNLLQIRVMGPLEMKFNIGYSLVLNFIGGVLALLASRKSRHVTIKS